MYFQFMCSAIFLQLGSTFVAKRIFDHAIEEAGEDVRACASAALMRSVPPSRNHQAAAPHETSFGAINTVSQLSIESSFANKLHIFLIRPAVEVRHVV